MRWQQVYMLYVICDIVDCGLWIVLMSDKVLVSGGSSSMKTASPYWVEGTDSSDTHVTSTRPNSFIATVIFPSKGLVWCLGGCDGDLGGSGGWTPGTVRS